MRVGRHKRLLGQCDGNDLSATRVGAPNALPHVGVAVRLGVSEIHGIGVFAAQPIAAGANVFAGDQAEITWVPESILDDPGLTDFQRSLYRDFAIRRGTELGCPSSFALLTTGWFVNEPRPGEAPNLTSTDAFDLIALRDIHPGEELTVLYSSFSNARP